MRKADLNDLIRREVRAVLRLSPWLLVVLLLVGAMWYADPTTVSGLLQSPPPDSGEFQSPPGPLPTSAPPPTRAPTQVPTQAPTAVPTTPPTVAPPETFTPEASVTPEQPDITPTMTITVPTEIMPTETPTELPPTPTETMAPPTETPAPPTATPVPSPTPTPEPDLKFNWGDLVDAMALGLTRVWLCCGVLVLFGIVVLFVVLWVTSNRRKQQGESPEEAQDE